MKLSIVNIQNRLSQLFHFKWNSWLSFEETGIDKVGEAVNKNRDFDTIVSKSRFFLAETARFELAGDCSLTDFESAPL